MTADEIRQLVNHCEWDGDFERQRMTIFGEMAAQLADLNEFLRSVSTWSRDNGAIVVREEKG